MSDLKQIIERLRWLHPPIHSARSAADMLERIQEAMQGVQTGKLSFEAFAFVVGHIIDPVVLTEAHMAHAQKKLAEIRAAEENASPPEA